MKINKLEIENVKRVRALTLEPSANGLTVIGGRNGQGKTSVLDAIAWALGGEKYRPGSPVREGSVIPPSLKVELSNGIIVARKGKNSALTVTDPKGEIYRTMRKPLEAKGLRVRTFNLVDLRQSNRFNPLAYINDTEPETGVAQLTETIMANTSGKESRGDGFWERAERALLTALIAYVWATTTEESGQMHLPSVVDLHKAMEGSESNPDEFNSDTDLKMEAARKIVEEWKADPAAFGAEDEAVMKMLDFAARQYRVYQQGPAETRLSVVISLGVRLAPLDMHDVRALLSADDIALDRIGAERTALFLQIPDSHATFRFLAAMFWQSLFEKNIYIADHSPGGSLPVPVHCFLDEFANIGGGADHARGDIRPATDRTERRRQELT